jgi:hypothetical protein
VDPPTLVGPPEGPARQRADQPGDTARRPDKAEDKAPDLLAVLAKRQPAGFPMDSMAPVGLPADPSFPAGPPGGLAHQGADQGAGGSARRPDRTEDKALDLLAV